MYKIKYPSFCYTKKYTKKVKYENLDTNYFFNVILEPTAVITTYLPSLLCPSHV